MNYNIKMHLLRRTARRRAREYAVQALYSWQISHNKIIDIKTQFLSEQDLKNVDVAYFYKLYKGVTIYSKQLKNIIESYISHQIKRLGYVEYTVLLIALFELIKCQDVPYKVAINEAIELAKTFGNEFSYKFINGILDKIGVTIRPNKK